ncbi:MAG: 3-phenylpropionate MFS transporter [Rhodospirillaceae bacterium]|nr:3-phenylpropionate MFS transporter [Rhodospirillaceae bacterium]|tara:strand:+ start:5269 stop:6405 length:1137 start_codon:yes stop_codon:yes gene_type:complete
MTATRISLFYGALFLVIGVILPFWPVWLESRGLSLTQIGFVISAGLWIRALSNPFIAQLADRFGQPKKLIIGLAWGSLFSHLLFFSANEFWSLLIVSIPATMLLFALMPLGDAVTMLKVRSGQVDYGRVRLWGSLTFILTASFSGFFLEDQPADAILWLIILFIIFTIAACHYLPKTITSGNQNFFSPIKAVFSSPPALVFMGGAALVQASHGVLYGFATIHWRSAGISEGVIGALWAEGVIAEILLFSVSGILFKRFKPIHFLLIAALAGILRWMILAETTVLPALIFAQLLHAFTFGATHLAGLHFIMKMIPERFAATAQSIYSSTAVGGAMAISTMFSGFLYDEYGAYSFYAMGVMCLAGLLTAMFSWHQIKNLE